MNNRPRLTSILLLIVGVGLPGVCLAQADRPSTRPSTRPTTNPRASTPTTTASTAPATRPVPAYKPAPALPPVLSKTTLESAQELKALQEQVKTVLAKVAPAVVGVRVGGFGSGVLITDDGFVLTAGHVVSAPNRDALIYLPDGRRVKARTLGVNYSIDSGLVKITEPGPLPGGKWPFVEMGKSADLKRGNWCIALGHPGGVKPGRTPPLRLGRMLTVTPGVLRTECTLVGGDSGGPLFDLNGRVIGIHSRIGGGINDNLHVPVDTFRDTWDRLASAQSWGTTVAAGNRNGPYLGVQVNQGAPECLVESVLGDSPAAKAGIKAGDVITGFDNRPVASFGEFLLRLNRKKPGEEVNVELKRGVETVKLKVTLAKRPEN